MASRFFALVVWAAVAASVAYWGLRWLSRPAAVPAHATPVTLDAAVRGDIHRLLSPPAQAASGPAMAQTEAQTLAGRLKLMGVIAPRDETANSGVALLSLDGKPARAVRVGMVIDGTYVLRTLNQRSAGIGPAEGPVAASLDLPLLPAPATGLQPAPTGVLQSTTMPSVAAMQAPHTATSAAPTAPPMGAAGPSAGSPYFPQANNLPAYGAAQPRAAGPRHGRRFGNAPPDAGGGAEGGMPPEGAPPQATN